MALVGHHNQQFMDLAERVIQAGEPRWRGLWGRLSGWTSLTARWARLAALRSPWMACRVGPQEEAGA